MMSEVCDDSWVPRANEEIVRSLGVDVITERAHFPFTRRVRKNWPASPYGKMVRPCCNKVRTRPSFVEGVPGGCVQQCVGATEACTVKVGHNGLNHLSGWERKNDALETFHFGGKFNHPARHHYRIGRTHQEHEYCQQSVLIPRDREERERRECREVT